MSREIKFRIWDDTPIKDGLKGIIINNEYAIKSSYLIDALSGKYPIMQYTGLKDKKGVEIYEGDITKDKYVIMWHKEKGLFAEHFYSIFRNIWHPSSYPISSHGIEIIGNIHENPELLNQPI